MDKRADETVFGRALKRRGVIAGAASAAGLVAKRAAEDAPVAAYGATWIFPYVDTARCAVRPRRGHNTASGMRFARIELATRERTPTAPRVR